MIWPVPPQYVVLDIETTSGDPCEAEAWVRRVWCPSKTWKPATIGARYLEAVEKKEERLALLDTAPIISVALRTEADWRVVHWLPHDEPSIVGASMERCSDKRHMLARVAELMGQVEPETVLVGHNILHFDLPKLRRAMLAQGIRLPACLVYRDQATYDTMRQWRSFTLDDRQFIALSELLETCGLPNHKDLVSGAIVPELYEQGKYREILAYAAADAAAEWAVFMRMTGQAAGVAVPPPEIPAETPVETPAAVTTPQSPIPNPPTEADASLETLLQKMGA